MTVGRKKSQRGSAVIEFALVFLPLTFLLLGIVEAARVGWMHQTLTMSVKTVARQTVVRGEKCVEASPDCGKTVANWVDAVRRVAVGLDATKLKLVLATDSSTKTCAPALSCTTDTTLWPPESENSVGLPVTIRGTYEMVPF